MSEDYTKIDDPYDKNFSRAVELPEITPINNVIDENTVFESVWITAAIRSLDYKPGGLGFSIDGRTGNAEFNNVKMQGTITGSSIYIPDSANPLFSVDEDGNVVVTSLRRRDYSWFTVFESVDGYFTTGSGTGTTTATSNGLALSTGATMGSRAELEKNTSSISTFTWDKKRRIKVLMRISSISDVSGTIVTGKWSSISNPRHFGFAISGSSLYGEAADGTTSSQTLLQTIAAATTYELEAIINPGVSVEFYVDGILKGTHTTNIPTGITDAYTIITANAGNSAAFDKTLNLFYYDFWQEG